MGLIQFLADRIGPRTFIKSSKVFCDVGEVYVKIPELIREGRARDYALGIQEMAKAYERNNREDSDGRYNELCGRLKFCLSFNLDFEDDGAPSFDCVINVPGTCYSASTRDVEFHGRPRFWSCWCQYLKLSEYERDINPVARKRED